VENTGIQGVPRTVTTPKPPSAAIPLQRVWVLAAALVAVTWAAYWGVGDAGFVNLDDDAYVEFQPMVNQGLRTATVAWAFTGSHGGLWFPLTSLSHALDCQLFGVRPGPMHLENVGWHVLNTLLVFFVWRTLTGAVWRSALVAALFALHPLNVESVAWISERKNLLSTFFWLLGLGAYVRYVSGPTLARYGLVLLTLVFALLSKPMAVTFPFTLLLLDYWPLRRWPALGWPKLVWEKVPLFALTAAISALTILAQSSAGAADFGRRIGLGDRIGNALVSCVRYLGKAAWPDSLAAFYPHPGAWPVAAVVGAAVFLGVISVWAWRQRRAQPWFLFGWLWFLGTLVPVSGLIQVGAQAMANRYAYVPLLGIFVVLAWAGGEIATRWPKARLGLAVAAACMLAGCFLLTRRNTPAWNDSVQLHEHSIAAGVDSATSRYLLAVAYEKAGRPEADVVAQFRRALELDSTYINAHAQLATIALRHQRVDEAWAIAQTALRLEPTNPAVHLSAAAACLWRQRTDDAIAYLREALRLKPHYAEAHRTLAGVFAQQNRLEEARTHLEAAVRAAPWDAEALCDLGVLLGSMRQFELARLRLERALWINPRLDRARDNLVAIANLARAKP